MDWALLLLFLFQLTLSVQLQIEAGKSTYEAEFGSDVVLACRFQPIPADPHQKLEVQWHWVKPGPAKEVYRLEGQEEQTKSQSLHYRGRVSLLREQLRDGWIKLKISRLQINDSGTYQCIVKTDSATDYIETTLSVKAPYKTVSKHLQKAADNELLLLTCQSEGHPKTAAVWLDWRGNTINSSTSFELTPLQLFRASSQIRVPAALKGNYTCRFLHGGSSASFHIPDDMPVDPDGRKVALITALVVGVLVSAATLAAVFHLQQRRKSRMLSAASGSPRTSERTGCKWQPVL